MHILICVFYRAPFGGLHSNVFATVRHCMRQGHRVTVLCREGPFREQLAAAGAHTIVTDYAATEESVQSVLAQTSESYDVIHAHPFASRKVGQALGRALSVPVIVTFHGMYDDELGEAIGQYTAVVAVSQGIRDYLAAIVPDHRQKLFVAPNGVDLTVFRPRLDDQPNSTASRDAKTRITLVSRLDGDKRLVIEMLFKALSHTASSHKGQVSWDIVGQGSELEAVKAKAEQAAQAGDFPVRFPGWLQGEALADAYRSSDIVIAPGRCALEAMACAKATIAIGSKAYVGLITPENWQAGAYSNFGGLGRGLDGYEPGHIERELSAAIASSELRASLGTLGLAITQSFYDEEAINDRLVALYDMCRLAASH